jgi:hypothetical protein
MTLMWPKVRERSVRRNRGHNPVSVPRGKHAAEGFDAVGESPGAALGRKVSNLFPGKDATRRDEGL